MAAAFLRLDGQPRAIEEQLNAPRLLAQSAAATFYRSRMVWMLSAVSAVSICLLPDGHSISTLSTRFELRPRGHQAVVCGFAARPQFNGALRQHNASA